jgi:energy-coupling factor transporter ATP-binding protein EcfA2
MSKIDCQPRTKEFTRKIFKALLDFSYLEQDKKDRAIGCEWIVSGKVIQFTISKRQLQDFYGGVHSEKIFEDEIRPAVRDYLGHVLGVVRNMTATGGLRKFELHLWDDTKDGNLARFDREWDSKAKEWNSQKAQVSAKKSVKVGQGINWLTKCRGIFEEHQTRLSSNPLQDITPKHFKDVYVPLGLVERKTKERPQIDRDFDPLPDRDSEFNQVETKITPVKHCDFMKAVIDRQPGEHIVILGEPGAGKTTLLTSVWQSLLDNLDSADPETPSIIIWVPLAGLGDLTLKKYVEESWIELNCKDKDKQAYLESLTSLREAGRLCLLLDGADEIGGDGLQKIYKYLDSEWAKTIKSVVTCRLNLWDGSGRNELKQNFQIFRTLEFKYENPAMEDEVEKFILKWFENADAGKNLRAALEETGKERIKYLAQNPLRLTLLCNIWQRGEGLPDTQAELYKRFVNYFYGWSKFPQAARLRGKLDPLMGKLAKYGINKPTLRFRFTEMELRTQLQDEDLIQALKDSVWLNFLGTDLTGENIYAFFHPTFQEYFAACSIDDWDYFLPRAHIDRPVICQGEDVPTYRVFDRQWQEVIFLWVGRDSINLEDKNNFANRIAGFNDGCGEYKFYAERSKYLISVLTSMIVTKATKQQEESCTKEEDDNLNEIRQLLTKDNSIDKDKLVDLINSILWTEPYWKDNSCKFTLFDKINTGFEIGKAARQCKLNHVFLEIMIQYIDRKDLSEGQKICLSATLIGFDAHPKAVNTLDDILNNSTSLHHKIYVAEILFYFDKTKSVNAFKDILCDPSLDEYMRCWLFNPIIRICKNETTIIKAVVSLIKNHTLKEFRSYCIRVLAYISSNVNQESTDVLIEILKSKEYDNDLKNSALRAIGMMDNKHPAVVEILNQLVGHENDDNSLLAARILSSWIDYPSFYSSYHSN